MRQPNSLYVHILLEIDITACFRLEVASFFVVALVLLLLMIWLFFMLLTGSVSQFVGKGICCYSDVIQCYCLSDCKLEIPLGILSCPLRAPGVYLDSRALFVFLRSD